MANCPKCGKRLHFYNVSQFCPQCGVNMNFYNFAENFYREAKIAELSQADAHVKIKHIKAAFIGSKLAVARLVVMLLPLVGFLIPAGKIALNIPFLEASNVDISGLGLFNTFSTGGLNYFLEMVNGSAFGSEFKPIITAFLIYAVCAVFAVFVLLTSLLCFISYKNMHKITTIVSALGILSSVTANIYILKLVSLEAESVMVSVNGGFGLWVAAGLFAVTFVVNFLLWKNGIPASYDEGMLERAEIYKKYKKGEIDIDTLPQPVVETETTRKIEEEIRKEEEAYAEKHGKKAAEV